MLVGLLVIGTEPVEGQPDYRARLGLQQGDETSFMPQGVGVMLDAVDPAVRRWYVPQELFQEYHWRQWEHTNYARDLYQRYVDTGIEGDYFYDLYGNQLTQGWLIFNTSQTHPKEFGNVIYKARRFRSWFSEVVVSAEQKGQYHYALTVSSNLRTILTPMVFSKPRLNGAQFDLATDKYQATLIHSLISAPGTLGQEVGMTNATVLVGGRLITQVGDFVEMGFHSVNAHQSNSQTDKLVGNLLSGSLTEAQNHTISSIQIVLRDDSPEDGVGGAALFPAGSDILITYRDGTRDFGKDIRFEPIVEGGFVEKGFIAANGNEEIHLLYDFDSPGFLSRASADKAEIVEVEFRLVLGNDYQVWMTSNQQTNRDGEPVLLLVAQAEGNVKDISNLRTISFEYGLPTATHILGGTIKVADVLGFDLYGEYDLSWSHRKYPNVLEETHKASSGIRGQRSSPAWMVNLSKHAYPFFFFGEAYHMDPLYNSRSFVTSSSGAIDYASERNWVDLVEDNDDQDRIPDSYRFDWLTPDRQVFPGWDQNNDFVPDFNQNDNRVKINAIPDYEEPFLRYSVDRPEFLFGVDMNHNFWVDQYENDAEPDYPYRKDHRGFNLYGGTHITQNLRLMVGALREELISADKQNHSTYALLTFDHDSPRYGRLRLSEVTKRVKDDIPNPLLQWSPDNTLRGGQLVEVEDPLLARDTWVNQLFVGHSLQSASLHVTSKVNYVLFHQLMAKRRRQRHQLAQSDYFFGVINKANYRYALGKLTLEPRWKSEFIKQSRDLFTLDSRTTLMELFSGLAELEVLQVTRLQAGLEYMLFNDLDADANDFNSLTLAFQFVNESEYQGYRIKALTGIVVERRYPKGMKSTTTTQSFITIYAGLQ